MSWFTRKLATSLGSQEERTSEDDSDGEQARTQGKGLKEDLSELTQTFTRQLWGVASFLAPPPQTHPIEDPDEDLVPPSASQLVDPLNVGQTPLAAELVDVDLQPSSKEDNVDKPHIDVEQLRHQDVATTLDRSSVLALTGINKDLAELKDGVASGISMFMKAMREEVDDEDSFPDQVYTEGATKKQRQLPDFNHLFKPFLGSILHDDRDANLNNENEEEGANDNNGQVQKAFTLPRPLGDGLGGISKLASSLFPASLDSDEKGDVTQAYQFQQVVGVNDEVVAFARNISMHPETWMDFPLFTDTEEDDDFTVSDAQRQHIRQVELAAPRFAALRMELCPDYMSESRFLKIYFVLLHSRLPKADATLLSTPEILKARELLVRKLGKEEAPLERETENDKSFKIVSLQAATKVGPQDFGVDAGSNKVLPCGAQMEAYGMEEVQNKNVLANTVRLTGFRCEDDEADAERWLNEEASVPPTGPFVGLAGNEDDGSFSDSEEDEDAASKAGESSSSQRSSEWVQLNKSRESMNTSKMDQARSVQVPVVGISSSKSSFVRTGKGPENGESSDWSTVEEDDIAGADF